MSHGGPAVGVAMIFFGAGGPICITVFGRCSWGTVACPPFNAGTNLTQVLMHESVA